MTVLTGQEGFLEVTPEMLSNIRDLMACGHTRASAVEQVIGRRPGEQVYPQ